MYMKTFHLILVFVLAIGLSVTNVNSVPVLADNGSSNFPTSAIFLNSPLKQIKSGISSNDVQCKANFTLIIKSEDGFPACVKPDTATVLIARGWAQSTILKSDASLDHTVNVISVKAVPPVTPGGPTVQLTLKNINVKPITSLNATLELNNSYVFNFKNVTQSQPLALGNSVSDTQILIGGGFTTQSTYPLTISGIAGGSLFSYTIKINITS